MRGSCLALLVSVTGCLSEPSGMGTRGEPTTIGVPAQIGSYEVVVGPTIAHADAVVAAEDETNLPPADGRQFVLVPMRLVYVGSSAGAPWVDLTIRFIAADGSMFGEHERDQCGVIPGSLEYIEEMAPGTSRLGTVCVSVPSDKVDGGSWVMRSDAQWRWRGFFEFATEEPTTPGSRMNPTPVGSAAEVGPYSISVGPTTRIGHRQAASDDGSNGSPAPGRQFILVPVTATFHGGTSSGNPWTDLAFEFVAADGSSYGTSEADFCDSVPDSIDSVGILAPGTTATGAICLSLPAEVGDGTWHVTQEGSAFDWAGYFALGE